MRERNWRAPAGGRDLAGWALGLACGIGASAADEALLLPLAVSLALGGALPLAWLALSRMQRTRRRAVVWEEVSWHRP